MGDDRDLFGEMSDGPEERPAVRGRRLPGVVQWTSEADALRIFATSTDATEGGAHIKPLHHYVACRLVIEGGFRPDDITPRPPFIVKEHRGVPHLEYLPESAGGGEATILGGLKTKNVDVVVLKPGIGPVVAVSCKGGARSSFR